MARGQAERAVTGQMETIDIRELSRQADLAGAIQLQKQIWGFEEIDLLPLRLFVVATRIGGQVLGAFDGSRMIGFCLAIPGIKPGGDAYLHGHMMGVLPEYRNKGVGRLLKLRQRTHALQHDLQLIEWTFDPLEIKNAFFNIERLGAIVRRYVLNQYGTTSSHLHGGLPTDRCVAEWHIRSPRVSLVVDGDGAPHRQPVEARIAVPSDIATLRQSDPGRAREIQQSVSAQFQEHFARGLAVTGFERSDAAGTYLLSKWQSN
jgi:predicted GNAT superfamily acetyltransferase